MKDTRYIINKLREQIRSLYKIHDAYLNNGEIDKANMISGIIDDCKCALDLDGTEEDNGKN